MCMYCYFYAKFVIKMVVEIYRIEGIEGFRFGKDFGFKFVCIFIFIMRVKILFFLFYGVF